MQNKKVELLAPAGSKEAFLGAIHAGADAVYLAGNKYGARAYADNFSEEDLLFAIRYAHIWGRKVYLAVNTLMKEKELQELYDYIRPFYEAGLDACIVQDIGAFQCLKNWFPEMELHVSTQMTITGSYGAEFLKELGASRVVPARELSLKEIKQMKEDTGLEIETFIHGAMCYSYSGQCLFSSILGGRSGNRGRCAQPCRLPYKVTVEKNQYNECYPLSLKDMCTIEQIEELMDAGIDSFKIEGRMKKTEYAAGVTSIYRKYLDLKEKQPQKKLVFEKKDLENLAKLYIRSERHSGYYYKQNGRDMITLDSPAYNGSDDFLLETIRKKYIDVRPKRKIQIYAQFICGKEAEVTFLCGTHAVTVYGNIVEEAKNNPLSAENIRKQLGKLGETTFEAEFLDVSTEGNIFYSLKAINELRRLAVEQLEDLLIENYGFVLKRRSTDFEDYNEAYIKCKSKTLFTKDLPKNKNEDGWTINITNEEQLKAVEGYLKNTNLFIERIYLESELILSKELSGILENQRKYIALPYCCREKDHTALKKLVAYAKEHAYNGFLVRNIEEYAILKKLGYAGEIYADASLYIWNERAFNFWEERITGIRCSHELNRKEYNYLFQNKQYEKMVYGRIPMMVTANCIRKTMGKCLNGNGISYCFLTDRYQKNFPVAVTCKFCYNIIYNSLPLSLHKDLMKQETSYVKNITFTTENEKQTFDILTFFEKISKGSEVKFPLPEYTTAHEKRGVE